jgi:hypothetical protein
VSIDLEAVVGSQALFYQLEGVETHKRERLPGTLRIETESCGKGFWEELKPDHGMFFTPAFPMKRIDHSKARQRSEELQQLVALDRLGPARPAPLCSRSGSSKQAWSRR